MYSARAGVVRAHLGGAGAPLVTRATPEGTTCERTQLTGLLSLELALIMRNDRVSGETHARTHKHAHARTCTHRCTVSHVWTDFYDRFLIQV